MKRGLRNSSWLASLRRDRVLFALAAVLLVLSRLLEPVAFAQASTLDMGASICTSGIADTSSPEPARGHDPFAEHCRPCVAGPCAGLALPPRANPIAAIIPPAREDGLTIRKEAAHTREGTGEPPPAIRAPPIFL
jgi:hypothetical protein